MAVAVYVAEVEVVWGCHCRVTYWPVGVCDPEDDDDYERVVDLVHPFYRAVDALLFARFGVCEHYPPSAYRHGDADLEITFHRLWDREMEAGYPAPGYEHLDELAAVEVR